jgi:hypothetical protein
MSVPAADAEVAILPRMSSAIKVFMMASLFCVRTDRTAFNRQVSREGTIVCVVKWRHTVETAELVVSQFMRDMSTAESVVTEATIHRDAGHAHRVNTKAAHVTGAEAADMRATDDAHVSTTEAANMTATKTATAARKGGTTGCG